MIPDTVDGLRAATADHNYVLSDGLAVSLFLALRKQRPLFLEARRASARPRLRRPWQGFWGGGSFACNAMRVWTSRPPPEWNYARQICRSVRRTGRGCPAPICSPTI